MNVLQFPVKVYSFEKFTRATPGSSLVLNIFVSYFSAFGPVQISWLGDTSAYVALKEHPENAKLVMKTLSFAAPGLAGLAITGTIFFSLPLKGFLSLDGALQKPSRNALLLDSLCQICMDIDLFPKS